MRSREGTGRGTFRAPSRGAGPAPGELRGRSIAGFTLIEVLVAFVILALTLGATYAALTGALRQEARAGGSLAGTLTARSYLDEAGIVRPLEPGTTEDTLPNGQHVTTTMREVEPLGTSQPPRLRAFEVEVQVTDPDGPTVALSTLKLAAP